MSFTEYKRRNYLLYGYLDGVHTPLGYTFTHYESTGFLLRVCFNQWS